MLRLATSHAFELVSTLSPTKSFALASHYHGCGERTRGRDSQSHGIHCNYCNRYDHIEAKCRIKVRQQ